MRVLKFLFAFLFICLFVFSRSEQVRAQTPTRLGGMNLWGYCTSLNQGGSTLINNTTWTCSSGTVINMTSACQWQYPGKSATASQDVANNPYTWSCYAGSTSPTPTPTRVPTTTPSPTPTKVPTPTPTASVPSPTPTVTPPANTMTLYDEGFGSGFRDGSYNATNAEVITPVYSGAKAMGSTIRGDGGFDIQSINGLMISNAQTTLRFALRASSANEQFEVYADSTYGQPLRDPVSLNNYGGQPTTSGWTLYAIPLQDLNAMNTLVRNIVIHDATGTNQTVIYIDSVQLTNITSTTPSPTLTPTPTVSAVPTPTPTTVPTGLIVRKSIYALTPAELTKLANAMNAMRASGAYQDFMNRHMQAMMTLTSPSDTSTQRNAGHRGPIFLPWHRALTWDFEQALRKIDPTVTLPYWPFETETAGVLPKVFTAAYFGGDGVPSQGDKVVDGPFASWGVVRRIGRDVGGASTLPTAAEVSTIMQITNYDSAPYSETSSGFRNSLEGWVGPHGQTNMHNRVHAYVGGDMMPAADPMSSNAVNDPIFWLAHANVDKLWWQWQQLHGITNYQPASGGPTGHNLNDSFQFLPTAGTPADTLNIETQMGYTYQ